MSLTLITADWHIDSRPLFDKVGKDGKSVRYQENIDLLSAMLERAKSLGCTRLVFLGDVSENKNPDSLANKAMAQLLRQALVYEWSIEALAGNHDGSLFNITSSSIEPLAIMAGDKFNVHHDISLKKKELFLPYQHKMNQVGLLQEIQKVVKNQKPSVAYGHYGAENCVVGPRNLVLPGDKLDKNTIAAMQVDTLFLGHIHNQQVLEISGTAVVIVGSPSINDFGERNDPKGFAVYDTETGEYELHKITPPRRWIQVDFSDLKNLGQNPPTAAVQHPWNPEDLVRVVGTHERGEDVSKVLTTITKAFTQPFLIKNDTETAKTSREVRGEEIAQADGFREAAIEFVRSSFANIEQGIKDSALELVLDKLKEQNKRVFGNSVVPQSIEAKKFMTFEDFSYEFSQGIPTLIYGPNGIGKTNILEAILYLISGQTSKGLDMKSLVRQGSQKATVRMILKVDTEIYRITKNISLVKKGESAKQEINLEILDGEDWKQRSDGGVAEVEALISEMVGASFLTLKSTNFLFQEDDSKFVKTVPSERKRVFSELLNFETITRAYRIIKDLYLMTTKVLEEKRGTLRGMETLFQESAAGLPAVEEALRQAKIKVSQHQEAVNLAQRSSDEAREKIVPQKATAASVLAKINLLPNTQAVLQASQAKLDTIVAQYSELRDKKNALYATKKAELAKVQESLPTVEAVVKEDERLRYINSEGIPPARSLVESIVRDHAEVLSKNGQIAATIKESLKALSGLQSNDIGKCSKCGQPLDTKHIEAEIDKTQLEIAEAQNKLSVGNLIQKKMEDNLAQARRGLKLFEEEALKITEHRNSCVAAKERALAITAELGNMVKEGTDAKAKYTSDVDDCNKDIADAKTADLDQQTLRNTLNSEYEKQQKILGELEDLSRQASERLTTAKLELQKWEHEVSVEENLIASIKKTEKAIAEVKKDIEGLELVFKIQELACSVLDPKTGLSIYLIDIKLPYLEERVNSYLDILGSDLNIRLSTTDGNKETLLILVDNGVQPMLDLAAFSGGQKNRIEMALKLAMAEMSVKTRGVSLGLLAWDEPATSFDEMGKAGLVKILFDKCQSEFNVTLIVSHDSSLMSSFDNKLALGQGPEKQTILL